ncbi:SEFIR domain-containing protein [Enterobacter hormaechei]
METQPPKLFVSYSWTTPEHEDFVMQLAEDLVSSGVDVIIDKWCLRDGQDSFSFMESMVNDKSINKVLIISDKGYAQKANDRKGGVGTETQIISPEVYTSADQTKFVVVVTEKDEQGQYYVPTFYKGRLFIDMTDQSSKSDGVEKILRWIFDKPVFIKPEIGKKPSFLDESPDVSLGTSAYYSRAMDAIRNGKPTAVGCFDEYLSVLAENLERIRFHISDQNEPDDAFIKNIESFIPARNEFVNLIFLAARYNMNGGYVKRLHSFFEHVLNYYYPPQNANTYNSNDFDNYKFIVHELYLYSIATLLKNELFEDCLGLFEGYYVSGRLARHDEPLTAYTEIREHVAILQWRNDSKKLGRLSLHADLLKERCHSLPINFSDLHQADFLCYLRSTIIYKDSYSFWWPVTLLYAKGYFPFEIFAKAVSKNYFSRIKSLLGVQTPEELKGHVKKLEESDRLPKWQFERISPLRMSNGDAIATIP